LEEKKDEKEEVDLRYTQAQADGFWVPHEISQGGINPRIIEVPRLYNYHTPSSEWLEHVPKRKSKLSFDDDHKEQKVQPEDKLQLIFNLKMAMYKAGAGDKTELYFSLYSSSKHTFLTEEYCIRLLKTGFPEIGDMERVRCVFKDLPLAMFQQEKLYIVCRIIRIGDLVLSAKESKTDYRRPFAVSVIPVFEYMTDGLLTTVNTGKEYAAQNTLIYRPSNYSNFYRLHEDIIDGRDDQYELLKQSVGLSNGFHIFCCEFSELRERLDEKQLMFFPHLTTLESTNPGPSIEYRHVLYVTIEKAIFSISNKRADPNVEIKMELRNNKTNETIAKVIRKGKNVFTKGDDVVRSTIYYHSPSPQFGEVYIIDIPPAIESLEHIHLWFQVAHISQTKADKTFGIAFVKLFEPKLNKLISNGVRTLDILNIKSKALKEYSSLNIDELAKCTLRNNQLTISTKLISSTVIPDSDIHLLLQWRTLDPAFMSHVISPKLARIQRKSIEELQTVFPEVIRALFEIMDATGKTESDKFQHELFSCIAHLLGQIQKPTKAAKRVLEVLLKWLETKFNVEHVWEPVIRSFLWLLTWMQSEEAADKSKAGLMKMRTNFKILQNAIKAIRVIFKILRRSFEADLRSIEGEEKSDGLHAKYNNALKQVFERFNTIMKMKSQAQLNPVKAQILRNFLGILDEFNAPSSMLAKIIVDFVDSVVDTNPSKKRASLTNVEKLVLIRGALQHKNITQQDVVDIILPRIVRHLKKHMGMSLDEKLTCIYIIKHCVEHLADTARRPPPFNLRKSQLKAKRMSERDIQMAVKRERSRSKAKPELKSDFARILLRMFVILDEVRNVDIRTRLTVPDKAIGRKFEAAKRQKTELTRRSSVQVKLETDFEQLEVHREIFVIIADLARTLCTGSARAAWGDSKSTYIENAMAQACEQNKDVGKKLIIKVLEINLGMISQSIFPEEWVYMRMVEAEIALRSLMWFESAMNRFYLQVGTFEKELWGLFIKLGVKVLTAKDFSLEFLTEGKAALIQRHYGDVREQIVDLIDGVWKKLQGKYSKMADIVVSEVVAGSASKLQKVLQLVSRMFFEIMQAEYKECGKIPTLTHHTIDQVDHLTWEYKDNKEILDRHKFFFTDRLAEQLDKVSVDLQSVGRSFIDDVSKLFEYLRDLKSLPADWEDERNTQTMRLLEYLKQTNKTEMHARYVVKLAIMHYELGNWVESGMAYCKRTSTMGWDTTEPPEEKKRAGKRGEVIMSEAKEHEGFLKKAMKCFDTGECFEKSIRVSQELAKVYETKLFKPLEIANLLKRQATLWECIATKDRVFLSVYLVHFVGDFDKVVAGNKFVYRAGTKGKPEGVMQFTNRIKAKFPEAEVVNKTAIPDRVNNPDYSGQYISITTLTYASQEESEGKPWRWEKLDAPLRIKKYYRQNETDVFTYDDIYRKEKKQKGENEFKGVWLNRVFVFTKHEVPWLQRRQLVTKITKLEYSPLEVAIYNVAVKNGQLAEVIETIQEEVKHGKPSSLNSLSMQLQGVVDAAVMGGIKKYQEAFFSGEYFEKFPDAIKLSESFHKVLAEQMKILIVGMDLYGDNCDEKLKAHHAFLDERLREMVKDLAGGMLKGMLDVGDEYAEEDSAAIL